MLANSMTNDWMRWLLAGGSLPQPALLIIEKVGAGAVISQVKEIVMPVPEIPFVVPHTYVYKPRQANHEVTVCAELWIGNQTITMTQLQQTLGLPPRTVKEYCPPTAGGAVPSV